ncbi:hypothetical protein GCM10007874_09020 [Labrys miyagiensis]|uniref:Uncharacterized protein n=1 Tax=Labrys miyagiensis TaxID=346912 RepID=A0ABQ6CI06_9HYPH|nr:hypothetical protein [Labrys miyagiensis]GLS17886.1 hypothetical protein GCM10007874_09020 [Labrys miyagiensis]
MSRPGRKRAIVAREKNGRPSRAQHPVEAMEAVVLAQPHRRGSTDRRCASVFGRFCLRLKLRQELTEAGEEYAATVKRWRAAKGVPTPFHNEASGSGRGAADATVAIWQRQMLAMERAMMEAGLKALLAVKQLTLDGNELGMDQDGPAVEGLMALAVHLGVMRKGAHPWM